MKVDYTKLQLQRNVLLSVQVSCNDEERSVLDGVVNLLEGLLDEGIDSGACRIDEQGNVIENTPEDDPFLVILD